MDQHAISRGRSPSQGLPNINHQSHSPSPAPFQNDSSNIGLGLGLDPALTNPTTDPTTTTAPHHQEHLSFDGTNGASFLSNQQLPPATAQDPSEPQTTTAPFAPQPSYNLSPAFNSGDFPLFQQPTSTPGEQFQPAPLFDNQTGSMASPQMHNSPTPPHLLNPDPHQPGHQSPSFNQHQFPPPGPPTGGSHSRNVSLGPEAALLPGQIGGWEGAAFQGHRRTPSDYSDVSSVTASPNLPSVDNFEQMSQGHSPLQRPEDGGNYDGMGFEGFSIADNNPSSPTPGRSPSHSPAISPRILPAQMATTPPPPAYTLQSNYMQAPPTFTTMPPPGESFPSLPPDTYSQDMNQVQMATPSISLTPAPMGMMGVLEGSKHHLESEALMPPEHRGRRRAHSDPYSAAGPVIARAGPGALSPHLGADIRSDTRSLSPGDRQASPSSRRKSIGSVPNNEMALRLADPQNHGGVEGTGGPKRQQKHPATFSCHLCPKKFTRAYNLRSHLRTHTDERPFVCSVCGKAFARQHDRKRHEGLHSGEKKFVCKGDLKQGGQWGCGRRFARADALGRHFRSEAGRICIKPLLDEEMAERQRAWNEQRMQQSLAAQQMQHPHMLADPNAGMYPPPMDPSGGFGLPQALLAQYPALAQMNWAPGPDMGVGGSGIEDELSGRSSFDASDLDDPDEQGYASGPGTGFGPGGDMNQQYGEVGGYGNDFGSRAKFE